MGSLILGLFIFNAFFKTHDYKFDTFEISQVKFKQNYKTDLKFNEELKETNGVSLGSREYDQATPWLRYGQATYIYRQSSTDTSNYKSLKQSGALVGIFTELNYKQYFGIGISIGGAATLTEFIDNKQIENERKNFIAFVSPYLTLGAPLTNTSSINLTLSTIYHSSPSEKFYKKTKGFETPHNLERKIGLELVWSWKNH